MRFAHFADCHVGAWREPKLRALNELAFTFAVDYCIEKKVDFILIAGDLFNTAIPAFDQLKTVVRKLKQLKSGGISVYAIAGSHDFSPSGKTMLDVLEEAELLKNVVRGDIEGDVLRLRFTVDEKTGAKITGMLGKRGMLERKYYESLDTKGLEKEQGFRIFMFHTALDELKPKELERMESAPVSFLPKDMDYYAGGHVHIVAQKEIEGYRRIVYPGPLFPNSFSELEKLGRGGFYMYDEGKAYYVPIELVKHVSLFIDCNQKTPEKIGEELLHEISHGTFGNSIVTIRLSGTLLSGRTTDIGLRAAFSLLEQKGAHLVIKSTAQLRTPEMEEIKTAAYSADQIEDTLIDEHAGKVLVKCMDAKKEKETTKRMLTILSSEKADGEKQSDFEDRITRELNRALELNL